jgi:GTP-binding protein HflX
MTRKAESLDIYLPKVLLVGIYGPYNKADQTSYFDEFINLAKSNGLVFEEPVFMKLREIDPSTFLTKGKLQELADICEKQQIDQVIISESLSPQQERNLTDALQARVFDRTQLILEIFEKAAHSAEGKLQVAIAMLQHKKARMAGKGIGYSQQRGVAGMRSGPGETAKEKEKRHIEESMLKFKRQLTHIQQARETQRKQRLTNEVPHICLVGYTNAGKSSVLNALTKSQVLAENKLFSTLDTTTRELFIDAHKKGLISDTVGFIQQLPHHLIEAFKSTLSELQYADLLAIVVDVSDKNWQTHIQVVHDVLDELEVINKDIVYVFNKIDKVEDKDKLLPLLKHYEPHVTVSALSKEGMLPLIEFLRNWKK